MFGRNFQTFGIVGIWGSTEIPSFFWLQMSVTCRKRKNRQVVEMSKSKGKNSHKIEPGWDNIDTKTAQSISLSLKLKSCILAILCLITPQ